MELTIEVLDHIGAFLDDRTPSFETWLEWKLDGITPGIRRNVEHWIRLLHDGGPRSKPRDEATVWNYLNRIRPVLIDWSSRYDHLREVTRDDVLAQLDALNGSQRQHTLIVLRSLFGRAKKNGTIFKNPTGRIRVGQREHGIIQPLEPEHIDNSVAAVAKPADRLVLALAAVHAARSDEQVIAAGSLLRALHDATSGSDLVGRFPVVCHHDPGPNNTIFRNGTPAAFIDFDTAAPGSPLEDLAYMAWIL
ncbi:hypothetical protein FCI23_21890 [Actinacidiphila oryziradicis]|uniref:Aminoglycoside phosphotransferase domain-containing protein n=2 Tax=Actinacidiphila oryziradicis TaxID=2571141 RepID=A0A4U0SIN5_9ACTN|nr:hypothetical protein FCI23_21890 [Actinacidiphila oryziradicis]